MIIKTTIKLKKRFLSTPSTTSLKQLSPSPDRTSKDTYSHINHPQCSKYGGSNVTIAILSSNSTKERTGCRLSMRESRKDIRLAGNYKNKGFRNLNKKGRFQKLTLSGICPNNLTLSNCKKGCSLFGHHLKRVCCSVH